MQGDAVINLVRIGYNCRDRDIVERIKESVVEIYDLKHCHSMFHYLPLEAFEAILLDDNRRLSLRQLTLKTVCLNLHLMGCSPNTLFIK